MNKTHPYPITCPEWKKIYTGGMILPFLCLPHNYGQFMPHTPHASCIIFPYFKLGVDSV